LRGLVETDHPLADLSWNRAEESFYNAAREGLDAELHWQTADGQHTTDPETIYAELFEIAREGLAAGGLADDEIDDYLAPIERRWEQRTTPSVWKKERVRQGLDGGLELSEAIQAMQRRYIELSQERDSFAEWL